MSTGNDPRDEAIRRALSPARLSTYESPFEGRVDQPVAAALDLYTWNTKVSGAFLAPLHICEVAVRNAVSDALEAIYGPSWPWSPGFQRSLKRYYREEMVKKCGKVESTGKLIPELNFGFWKSMFTSRYEDRIWATHLHPIFPGLPGDTPLGDLRESVFQDLERANSLRNRIAHHEPIFRRNLRKDLRIINRLVSNRCEHTAEWIRGQHEAELIGLLEDPPLPPRG